jgi:aspartokinase-like uncharacterized kinase
VTVRTVIKVGGGLLSRAGAFELVTGALAACAPGRGALVVPGRGPFADAVRELLQRVKVSGDAAYWMAALGMDQYAHALVERTAGAVLVEDLREIAAALERERIPVLAPYRWLRAADPLPHAREVSSDVVAAWVAQATGARRVVLIKPVTPDPARAVDPAYQRALPAGTDSVVLTPNDVAQLADALEEGPGPSAQRLAGQG